MSRTALAVFGYCSTPVRGCTDLLHDVFACAIGCTHDFDQLLSLCVADVGKLQIAKMRIQPRVNCALPKLEGLRCYGASAPVRVNRGGQEIVRLLTECQKRDGL